MQETTKTPSVSRQVAPILPHLGERFGAISPRNAGKLLGKASGLIWPRFPCRLWRAANPATQRKLVRAAGATKNREERRFLSTPLGQEEVLQVMPSKPRSECILPHRQTSRSSTAYRQDRLQRSGIPASHFPCHSPQGEKGSCNPSNDTPHRKPKALNLHGSALLSGFTTIPKASSIERCQPRIRLGRVPQEVHKLAELLTIDADFIAEPPSATR